MAQIDQTHLNEDSDKIKLARPALNAIASFVNKLLGYVTDDITTTEKTAMRTVLDVPKTDGTGATGAWDINISGNAATVSAGMYLVGDQSVDGVKTFQKALVVEGAIRVGRGNSAAFGNIAVGEEALINDISTGGNSAFGRSALKFNTTGTNNSAFGLGALRDNTSGQNNTSFGVGSMNLNTTGYDNVALGVLALTNNTTGYANVAIGSSALHTQTTFTERVGLGYAASVTGSNQVQLGKSTTTTYVYGTVQNRSDLRDKADVRDTTLGLNFINALRPVDYKWDMREDYRPERPADLSEDATDEEKAEHAEATTVWLEACKHENLVHDGSKKRNRYHHGLIAQEVKATLDQLGIDFGGYQDHKLQGGHDVLSIGYDELVAPLIKAVQQLSEQNFILSNRIAALESNT